MSHRPSSTSTPRVQIGLFLPGAVLVAMLFAFPLLHADDAPKKEVPAKPPGASKKESSKVAAEKRAAAQQAAQKQRDEMMKKQIDAMIQQSRLQWRTALFTELEFIRMNCDVPEEHREKIKAAGDKILEEAVRKAFQAQMQPVIVLANGVRAPKRAQPADPRAALSEGLADELKKVLPPEDFERYRVELDKRKESRKRATILFVAARIDKVLRLSPAQREKIAEAIANAWKQDYESWLIVALYAGQYVPEIPDDLIHPHLSEEQKILWKDLQKISFSPWNIGGMNMGLQPIVDDYWGKEPEAKPVNVPAVPANVDEG